MKIGNKSIIDKHVIPIITEQGYTYKFFRRPLSQSYLFTSIIPGLRMDISVSVLFGDTYPRIRFKVSQHRLFEYFNFIGIERFTDGYHFSTEEEMIDWIRLLLPYVFELELLFRGQKEQEVGNKLSWAVN